MISELPVYVKYGKVPLREYQSLLALEIEHGETMNAMYKGEVPE